MAVQTDGAFKAFKAGEAVADFRLVRISAEDTVLYCDAEHTPVGVTQEDKAINLSVTCRLMNAAGTSKVTAAAAIDAMDPIYPADDGKVNDIGLGAPIGIALEDASGDGSIIEAFICPGLLRETVAVMVTGGAGGITAGDLVYASDQTDGKMTVLPAQATSSGKLAIGICPNDIAAAAEGIMLTRWLKHGYDTSASSACGAPVYLSDGTAGANTFTKPTGTDQVQIVGQVVEDHASTGAVLFDLPGTKFITHNHTDASEGGGLTSPHITTGIEDANGAEALDIAATASAVNHLEIENQATGVSPRIEAKGDDTHVGIRLAPKGSAFISAEALFTDKRTATAATNTATLTAAEILTGIIDGTPTAAATYTLPTAALLVAAIPGVKVGDSFKFLVNNKSSGANTITVAGGTGSTDDGTLTVAQHVIREFRVTLTNVTLSSEAYRLDGIGS